MNIEDIINALQLEPSVTDIIERNWSRSMADLPDNLPEFLQTSVIRDSFSLSGIPSEVLPELEKTARHIGDDPCLKALAWHGHRCLTVYETPHFGYWPDINPLFYLLLALSIVPLLFKRYHERGLPEEVATACISSFVCNYNIFLKNSGKQGWDRRILHWVRHYIDLKCFEIGRFQYMLASAKQYNVMAFKHKSDGRILATCGPLPQYYNGNGLVCFPHEQVVFSGSFLENVDGAEMIPVDPRGVALNRFVHLNFSEWEKIISPEDSVLGVHIPTGGNMTLEKCEDSFRRAIQFFRTYFPEINNKAFFSSSWIFSPYYEKALPESNLARFMRELYLYPCNSSGKDGVFFIFGRDDEKFDDYPGDNSVRRAMLDVLRNGGKLRSGGMFFLIEHIEHFGKQFYRCQSMPDVALAGKR